MTETPEHRPMRRILRFLWRQIYPMGVGELLFWGLAFAMALERF